jgi:hypothetical protein
MSLLRTFVALCALVLVALPAFEADARGRGGGRGGGGRANVSRAGPAGHGSVRHHNRHHYPARRRRAVAHEIHSERHEYWEDRRRWRIGATLTAANYRALACQPTTVIVNGVAYYSCDDGWYTRRVYSGTVTYVVVTAPAGY